MRTLHVFHASDLKNGVDRVTLTLACALLDAGVQVRAWVPAEGDVTAALRLRRIPYELGELHCCTGPAWRAHLRFLGAAAQRAESMAESLAREPVDLVHLNTGHLIDAALAAASAQVPVLWHLHSPFEVDLARYERLGGAPAYSWILSTLGAGVIAVSHDAAQSLGEHLHPGRVHVLHNGIDLAGVRTAAAAQSRHEARRSIGVEPHHALVLGVGRISAQKDFATFVRVAERVLEERPETIFAIAGPPEDPALAAELGSLAARPHLRGQVRILGPRSDVPALMAAADVFLSTARFEGHPITTLEAMALGATVVAMRCAGLRECVEHGRSALLVELGDEAGLAAQVLRALADTELRHSLVERASWVVEERFSAAAFARGFVAIAERAIRDGPAAVQAGEVALMQSLFRTAGDAHTRLTEIEARPSWRQRLRRTFSSPGKS